MEEEPSGLLLLTEKYKKVKLHVDKPQIPLDWGKSGDFFLSALTKDT